MTKFWFWFKICSECIINYYVDNFWSLMKLCWNSLPIVVQVLQRAGCAGGCGAAKRLCLQWAGSGGGGGPPTDAGGTATGGRTWRGTTRMSWRRWWTTYWRRRNSNWRQNMTRHNAHVLKAVVDHLQTKVKWQLAVEHDMAQLQWSKESFL